MTPVYHHEKGTGRPLVLIHGFCETGKIWDRFIENLSESMRVIVPDLPGFGKSPLAPVPITIDQIGEMMLSWMKEIHLEKPVVIGHSLGGYVTLAMTAKEQNYFDGIGLFHSTAYPDSEEKKESRNKVIDFVRKNGVQPFIDTFAPGLFYQKNNPSLPEFHKLASRTSMKTLLAYTEAMRDRPSRLEVIKTFSKPILMIAGEEDTIVTYQPAVAQSEMMRFPVFCGLTGVGHMGMFENEHESLKIIKTFMNFTVGFDR